MGQFSRTRSKVWWPTYYQDEEDETEDPNVLPSHTAAVTSNNNPTSTSSSWRRALVVSGNHSNGSSSSSSTSSRSSRGSSSPSTGSQRSQDSGFSDSESSSSPSGGVKANSTNATIRTSKNETTNECSNKKQHAPPIIEGDVIESSADDDNKPLVNSLLPNTPVKLSKSSLLWHKNRSTKRKEENEAKEKNLELVKSRCGSISSYLAECYFPVYDFSRSSAVEISSTFSLPTYDNIGRTNEIVQDDSANNRTIGNRFVSSFSSHDGNSSLSSELNRTCFIVDELPKRRSSSLLPSTLLSPPAKFSDTSDSEATNIIGLDDRRNADRNITYDIIAATSTLTDAPKIQFPNQSDKQTAAADVSINSSSSSILCEYDQQQQQQQHRQLEKKSDDYWKSCSTPENLDVTQFSINSEILPTHTSTPKKSGNKYYTDAVAPIPERPPLPPKQQLSSAQQIDAVLTSEIDSHSELPVNYWLHELRYSCQAECTITLQSKSIISSNPLEIMARNSTVDISTEYVTTMYNKAKAIKEEFSQVYKKINRLAVDQMYPSLQTLINGISEFLANYTILLPKSEVNMNDDLILLMDLCDRLRLTVRHPKFGESLLEEINTLGQTFSHFVNNLLIIQVKMLLSLVKDSQTQSTTMVKTLSTITSLGTQIRHIGELVSYCDGVKYLLPLCGVSYTSDIRTGALRALAIICCYSGSLKQFEKDNGVKVLSEILSDLTRPENELLEAVSVLVQITAPWVEDSQCVKSISQYLGCLTNSLTCLISTTALDETLLLTAAALANISFLEPQTVWSLLEAGTIGCLLTAVRRQGTKASVFLQEQTATLIANMSSVAESRKHLAEHRAVVALLCFLQVGHSPLQTPAEIKATERLQHKAAIALSRLCSDTEICQQVVELNGVHWLVHLCKEERERNYRDDVLVACLASLRKISTNCGKSIIEELNAKELVEPRFVDSYLLYSSKQESYV